jgi:hypothetical protein
MRSNEAKAKNLTGKQAQRSTGRKAPGTRIGLMMDWREGSTKSGRLSGRYGRSLRDGK